VQIVQDQFAVFLPDRAKSLNRHDFGGIKSQTGRFTDAKAHSSTAAATTGRTAVLSVR
jgi:hypothetical protein